MDEFGVLRNSTIDIPKEKEIQAIRNELEETITRLNEEDYTEKSKRRKKLPQKEQLLVKKLKRLIRLMHQKKQH